MIDEVGRRALLKAMPGMEADPALHYFRTTPGPRPHGTVFTAG